MARGRRQQQQIVHARIGNWQLEGKMMVSVWGRRMHLDSFSASIVTDRSFCS